MSPSRRSPTVAATSTTARATRLTGSPFMELVCMGARSSI
jgi:hypothetical protein